jgi:iron complex outermembrane receptor protein
MLVEINKGGISDKNGIYKIENIKPGNYTIRVSALGFRTIKDSISIRVGRNVERHYKLLEDILNIGEIVVTRHKKSN